MVSTEGEPINDLSLLPTYFRSQWRSLLTDGSVTRWASATEDKSVRSHAKQGIPTQGCGIPWYTAMRRSEDFQKRHDFRGCPMPLTEVVLGRLALCRPSTGQSLASSPSQGPDGGRVPLVSLCFLSLKRRRPAFVLPVALVGFL